MDDLPSSLGSVRFSFLARRLTSLLGISSLVDLEKIFTFAQLWISSLGYPCLSFWQENLNHIALAFIWDDLHPLRESHRLYLDDVHLFKESYRLFCFWTMYIHLNNLIVFYLDDVHHFKDSYCLFCFWTMYIHLRNLIVFHLDDIHPLKESYHLSFERCTSI